MCIAMGTGVTTCIHTDTEAQLRLFRFHVQAMADVNKLGLGFSTGNNLQVRTLAQHSTTQHSATQKRTAQHSTGCGKHHAWKPGIFLDVIGTCKAAYTHHLTLLCWLPCLRGGRSIAAWLPHNTSFFFFLLQKHLRDSLEKASTIDGPPDTPLGTGPAALELQLSDVQKQRGLLADGVQQVWQALFAGNACAAYDMFANL